MQTSKKILITAAGVIVALLVTSLAVLRNDIEVLPQLGLGVEYKEVQLGEFEALEFSDHWEVVIKQGGKQKVAWGRAINTSSEAKIENKEGRLVFKTDEELRDEKMYASITVPSLKSIRATGETSIRMVDFEMDSLDVSLENGNFNGKNNKFDHLSFRTSGKSSLVFTDDGM